MPKKAMVKDKIAFDNYGRFVDFVEEINAKFNSIPEEFRNDACLDIIAFDSYDSYEIQMEYSYQRPETDEEREKRIKEENEIRKAMEENERKMYLKLKNKYEKE